MSSKAAAPVVIGIVLIALFAGIGISTSFFAKTSTSTTTSLSTVTLLSTTTSISTLAILSQTTLSSTVTSTSTQTSLVYSTLTQTSTSTTTYTSISTYSTTYSTTRTTTSISSIFPPSNSTYALTIVSGNATQNVNGCGQTNYNVFLTYEVHSQIPTNGLLVWVRFNDGVVVSAPATVFPNQAFLSLSSVYSRSYNACGQTNAITSLSAWVTDQSNSVLSPTKSMSIV